MLAEGSRRSQTQMHTPHLLSPSLLITYYLIFLNAHLIYTYTLVEILNTNCIFDIKKLLKS